MEAVQTTAPTRSREYETIYILRPDVSPANAEKVSDRVRDVLGRSGGKLTLVETWGRRGLAYTVKKHRRGLYVYLRYLGSGHAVNELERNLRMLDDVIRYQTVLVRAEVDAAAVQVVPDAVRFEAIEPPVDGEEEISRARLLGLEQAPRGPERTEGYPARDKSADSSDKAENRESEQEFDTESTAS